MQEDQDISHWRLDKRVNLPIVIVLVTQLAAGVAAFTKVHSDVGHAISRINTLDNRVQILDERNGAVEAMKVEIRFLNENMKRLRDVLDKLDAKIK